jgi:hypothetical protein
MPKPGERGCGWTAEAIDGGDTLSLPERLLG